jgi:pimeloyl-ACP methyl ester carboxylesterase
MTRPILAVFLVTLTVLAIGPVGAGPADARPAAGLSWQPCADDRTARCTALSVPVNWADPYSPKMTLAVAMRPATDPAHRIGALIVHPGGPGVSGFDFALGAASFFSPALRARFDIVGYDPRGVGRSNPIRCDSALLAAAPSSLISSPAQYDAAVAYNRKRDADCRSHSGPVFDHADTTSGVRDLDALRAALGEAKLSFYGASYGTLLGAQYADTYPDRVRVLALDSVMDHSAGVDDFLGTETDAVQDLFDQFVAWCAKDPTCVLRGQDVRAVWARLMTRAAAGTLTDPFHPGQRVDVSALVDVAYSSFYTPQWYSLATYMKAASAPAGRTAPPPPATTTDTFAAVFCNDWALPIAGYADLRDRLAALRVRAPQMLASPLALSAVTGCLGRTAPPVDPQTRLRPARTPTLLIGTRHDPATAYAWARNVAAQLGPAASLLTYDGWGHVAYGRTACVTARVDAYLIAGARPAAGSHCPGVVPPPFGVGKRTTPEERAPWSARYR